MDKKGKRLYHHKLTDANGLSLSLYEKKPTKNIAIGRAILLLHSATFSSLPEYDLPVAGYSLMDHFADQGFNVYALDVRGYGNSEKPSDHIWITADLAVNDVDLAVEHIKHDLGVSLVDILGWSWGTQVGGLYAQLYSSNVNSLILYAPFWTRINAKIPKLAKTRRINTPANILGDFLDRKRVEPKVIAMFERLCLRYDATSPLGAWQDLKGIGEKPILNPCKLTMPTLIIYGEYDHLVVSSDIDRFYTLLQSSDKELVVIEDADHMLHLELSLPLFKETIDNFLKR